MSSEERASPEEGPEAGLVTIERTLPSRLDSYHDLIQEVLDGLTALGWSSELFGIHMALEESISNGIRHGNKESDYKVVRVECRLSAETFWVRIRDEGEGYDPDEVPDCKAAENLDAPGGRGLELIRSYMDAVSLSESGTCMTMEKRRNPVAGDSDDDD
ncbi:MAG: ATP-binding protein [Planctomycetota bacterium]